MKEGRFVIHSRTISHVALLEVIRDACKAKLNCLTGRFLFVLQGVRRSADHAAALYTFPQVDPHEDPSAARH